MISSSSGLRRIVQRQHLSLKRRFLSSSSTSSIGQQQRRFHWQYSNDSSLATITYAGAVVAGLMASNYAFDVNQKNENDTRNDTIETEQHQKTNSKHARISSLSEVDGTDLQLWIDSLLDLPSFANDATSCEAATASGDFVDRTPNRMTGRFPSSLRRHQTIQRMQNTAVKDTLESNYIIEWNTPLGEGSFGQVYLATDKRTGEELAVKKISKQCTDNVSFQREMDALLHLRNHNGHPHICGLRENYDEGSFFYLILDLVCGGEMFDQLCTNGAYSEADAARLIREVANALAFLHGIGIVHGDMKPENLMLSSQNSSDAVIKVVDFGCAQTLIEDDDGKYIDLHAGDDRGTANTPAYCPPEVLEKKSKKKQQPKRRLNNNNKKDVVAASGGADISSLIDPSFDMWALGVILYIMLTGVHPFDLYGNATDDEIEHQIMSRQRPPLRNSPLTAHLSKDAIGVIESLIQWDPKRRLSAHELLQHPWVRGETARTNKMADSDKRLSAYRAFKTKLEAKVFADMASLTISSNDDDVPNEFEEISPTSGKRRKSDGGQAFNTGSGNNGMNNNNDNSVAKRTSLIELAFHSLDPQHKGYVTTSDLRKLSSDNTESDATTAADGCGESEGLNLSGFSDLLAENMKNRYFPKGHIVYHEGDIGNVMYFINSGSIEVYTNDGFSKTLRMQGDFFGEGALLHPKKIRSASIRCLTPVHAIEISREYFEKFLASDMNTKLNLREKDKSRKRQRAKAILRLQHNMEQRSYKKGDCLFKEGDEGYELYIVEDGNVDISVQNHFVLVIQPGEMCGEHSLILGRPRNSTATCGSENGCTVHVLRARDFYALLDTHPSMKESVRDICLRREFQKSLCLKTKQSFPRNEIDLKIAFDAVDSNQDGSISLPDIRDMIQNLDPTYTEEDVVAILQTLDLDETGKVSWAEFKRIFGMDNKRQMTKNKK